MCDLYIKYTNLDPILRIENQVLIQHQVRFTYNKIYKSRSLRRKSENQVLTMMEQ